MLQYAHPLALEIALKAPQFSQIKWLKRSQMAMRMSDAQFRRHLCDDSSLTAKLIALSQGSFRVELLAQGLKRPHRDEAHSVGLNSKHYALVREVFLHGQALGTNEAEASEPWVYARSILPTSSLLGANRHLAMLGNKPLGAALFADPMMRRAAMRYCELSWQQLCHLSAGQLKCDARPANTLVWGRKSCFYVRQKPILVAEYFLPAFESALRQN